MLLITKNTIIIKEGKENVIYILSKMLYLY